MSALGALPGNWDEPEETVVDELTRWGSLAADLVMIEAMLESHTPAQETEMAVRAALRALLANGLITAVIPEEIWFVPKP